MAHIGTRWTNYFAPVELVGFVQHFVFHFDLPALLTFIDVDLCAQSVLYLWLSEG